MISTQTAAAHATTRDKEHEGVGILARALARGTGVNLIGFAARILFVLLHSFLAARLFGAEAYGVYSVGIASVALLCAIGQLGLDRTITRFVALYRAKGESRHVRSTLRVVLITSMPVSLALGVALSLGAEPMSALFGEPRLMLPFRLLGFAVPLLALANLLTAFTQGFQQMRPRVLALDMVGPGIEVIGLVVLSYLGAQQTGLSLAYVLSVATSGALLVHYAGHCLRRSDAASADRPTRHRTVSLKPLIVFAIPVLAVDVLMSATHRINILMLGALGTSAMVGIFSVLTRMTSLGATLLVSLNRMFSPVVAELVEQQRLAELSRLYKISTRWALLAGLPFYLLLGFLGHEILYLYGSEFVEGAAALWYLVGAGVFNVSTGSCGVILMMSGRPQYSAINQFIDLVLLIAASFLLIPRYGLLGAACASAVGGITVNSLRVVQVWWHLRIHPYSIALLKVAMAGVAMGITLWARQVVWGHGEGSLLTVGLWAAGSILVYAALLLFLRLEAEEKSMFRAVHTKLLSSRLSAQQGQ